MHDVKGYLSAAVIWAIVMVISFAICVKRRMKSADDPTEMPRKGRIAANGSGPGKVPVGIKPTAAKEEKTALPLSKKPKGEGTLPCSESLAPPPEERPKTPGKCVEQDPGSSLKSWNLIKDEHVSFE
ncbi:hypothetical protein Aduo_014249 [Ancylostoma duodenale]